MYQCMWKAIICISFTLLVISNQNKRKIYLFSSLVVTDDQSDVF
jgi:hypothetical protein